MAITEEQKKEVKEIWLKYKDEMKAGEIYSEYLGDYFESRQKSGKDWALFISWVRDWKRELENKDADEEGEELTDEQAEELQARNRKRTIVLANKLLDKYYEDPKKMTEGIDVMEIRRLIKTIEGIDQARERTRIARGKLQLDAAKTILPYQRMSLEDLEALVKQIVKAINEIKSQKQLGPGETKPDGPTPVGVGGV